MQIGSYVWNGFNGTLSYGFRKLDEGAACISKVTLVAAHKILQTEPNCLFAHRFSPRLYGAVLWVKDNPQAINQIMNLCMLASNIAQEEICLDTISYLLQLFINDKTNPKLNRLFTFINAISIYQVGTSQLLGTTESTFVYNLINSSTHLHNICHNSFMIRRYNDGEAVSKKEK